MYLSRRCRCWCWRRSFWYSGPPGRGWTSSASTQACVHSDARPHHVSYGSKDPTLKQSIQAYLINGTRNHAAHLTHTQHIGEGRRERGSGLNGGEGLLTNIGAFVKAKDGASLHVIPSKEPYRVHSHTFLNAHHVVIHLTHIVHIIENKSLLKTAGKNIPF